jgi:hypothetical protein
LPLLPRWQQDAALRYSRVLSCDDASIKALLRFTNK